MSEIVTKNEGRLYYKNDLWECEGWFYSDRRALENHLMECPEDFGWEGQVVREVIYLDQGIWDYQINLVWEECDEGTCDHAAENETCPAIEEFVSTSIKQYVSLV